MKLNLQKADGQQQQAPLLGLRSPQPQAFVQIYRHKLPPVEQASYPIRNQLGKCPLTSPAILNSVWASLGLVDKRPVNCQSCAFKALDHIFASQWSEYLSVNSAAV